MTEEPTDRLRTALARAEDWEASARREHEETLRLKAILAEREQRLAILEGTNADLHRQLLETVRAAHARIRQVEASYAGQPKAAEEIDATDRFRHAKQAFARLYHPDNQTASAAERALRTEIFKEFWTELERIERS